MPRPAISIRPTAAGAMLAVVLVAVLGGAVNYQSNAAYLVLALVGSTALVSALHAWRDLDGVVVTAGPAPPAFAGEPLQGTLTVAAGGRERAALEFLVPDLDPAPVARGVRLAASAVDRVVFSLPARARGLHPGRVRIATTFPLGLFRAWRDMPVELAWLVYPRPLAEEAATAAETAPERENDGMVSAGGGDFRGHRAFVPGDPQRHVDWRAVARGRPMLIKEYGASRGVRRWIAWDEAGDGDVERRLSRLAARVVAAERAGDAYGLRLPGREFAPAAGHDHRHACLEALALFPGAR